MKNYLVAALMIVFYSSLTSQCVCYEAISAEVVQTATDLFIDASDDPDSPLYQTLRWQTADGQLTGEHNKDYKLGLRWYVDQFALERALAEWHDSAVLAGYDFKRRPSVKYTNETLAITWYGDGPYPDFNEAGLLMSHVGRTIGQDTLVENLGYSITHNGTNWINESTGEVVAYESIIENGFTPCANSITETNSTCFESLVDVQEYDAINYFYFSSNSLYYYVINVGGVEVYREAFNFATGLEGIRKRFYELAEQYQFYSGADLASFPKVGNPIHDLNEESPLSTIYTPYTNREGVGMITQPDTGGGEAYPIIQRISSKDVISDQEVHDFFQDASYLEYPLFQEYALYTDTTHLVLPKGGDIDLDGVPDECDLCAGHNDCHDTDQDGIPDDCDRCPSFDDRLDTDNDGVPNGCDSCEGFDDSIDTDQDGTPDGCDRCPSFDDKLDTDSDDVPNGCDSCEGFDDSIDTDQDGTPDGCDRCPSFDDRLDTDSDGVPNACDSCEGFDDSIDTDQDGTPDGCDRCPSFDDRLDTDNDGIPNGCDVCEGFDDSIDIDQDGIPDGCDQCIDRSGRDSDNDGIGDDCDDEVTLQDCTDGLDNDGDGRFDCDDEDCQKLLHSKMTNQKVKKNHN